MMTWGRDTWWDRILGRKGSRRPSDSGGRRSGRSVAPMVGPQDASSPAGGRPPESAVPPPQVGDASQPQMSEDGVPAEWKVGDVILDLYEVTAVLGEGGMGKVHRVRHRGWN